MHVMGATEELSRPRLDVILREADLRSLENASQVILHVLKDHEDVLWNRALFCVAVGLQQSTKALSVMQALTSEVRANTTRHEEECCTERYGAKTPKENDP